jgi:protein-S-isoprenylcysteine O-methyltransferase Ste14
VTSLPLDHPGARIAFDLVVGAFLLSEVRVRLRSDRNREGSRLDRMSMRVVQATAFVGVGGAVLLTRRAPGVAVTAGARWPLFVAGLVLMCAGIAIRQWAVSTLGRFFTTDVRVQSGQTVVDRGPYRWVQHPSYTGLIATFLGLGLALGNWAALAVIAVVPTLGLVYRIRVEEDALLEGLGEPYRRFAASRARLFPGVW